MTSHIRLAVLMPRRLLRSGLVSALQSRPDIEIVGEFGTPIELIKAVKKDRPTVALLRPGSGDGDGGSDLALCRSVRRASPSTRMLLMYRGPTSELARATLDAGARGVFDTNLGIDLLLRAIRAVADGEIWMSRSLLTVLATTPRSDPRTRAAATTEAPTLSARELEVLALLAEGRDHRSIAEGLFVSPHTARTHIRNVLRKLGAHSRLEAVVIGAERGLIANPSHVDLADR